MIEKKLKKISALLSPACEANCPDKSRERCCDRRFCELTEKHLKRIGKHYPQPHHLNVPYLSENGCVVPPEYRPLCTMYACPAVLEDKKVAKKWKRLEQDAVYFLSKDNRESVKGKG